MSVGGEFGRRVSDDELCAEVRQAVEDGDEDALRRLGFGGFGGYVQRLSEIMSDSVTDGLDLSAEDFGTIMGEVASPARYAHHLVNEAGTAVQRAKDEPLGIHMKPIETDFDDDALCGTVGKAASMDTPEQTVATLADGLAYAVKKAGNEFIEKNAEQRSRAGFEVKVKRSGSTKCCPWCAARIGSWAIANAPDGVFGCHANCSCTVEYTSSTGVKTSARGANLHRYGAGAFVEVEYEPPHVMTHEEAREKGGFDEPKRLISSNGLLHLEVQDEYYKKATPGKGNFTLDTNCEGERYDDERKFAEWLYNTLGGDIHVFEEKNRQGIKDPDYLWNNKLWDLKSPQSEKGVNGLLRKGLQQIAENPGGVFIDFRNVSFSEGELQKVIDKRMQWVHDKTVDIMIISNGKIVKVLRYKK